MFYGCQAWSLTLREKRKLRVFENKILRRIFGPKRDENEHLKMFQNNELNNLYRSSNVDKACSQNVKSWRAFNILELNMQERDL